MTTQRSGLSDEQHRTAHRVLGGLLVLFVSGCFSDGMPDEVRCTPADTTHSCCVKKYLMTPGACDGIEGVQGESFRLSSASHREMSPEKVAVATGTATAAVGVAAVLATMSDSAQTKKLQKRLDEVMEECAEFAHQAVDARRPKGEILDSIRCNEAVEVDQDGKPMTRAMQLGNEKHKEALICVEARLRSLLEGLFSIEQRYRYDMTSGRLELVSLEEELRLLQQGRRIGLQGTLKPDVVIHSGNPIQVRFLYDFKFPCVEGTLATWRIYTKGPYRDLTQGQIYRKAFGVRPGRVEPGRKGIIR